MAFRIKELCRERHTTLAEIAKQINWKDKNGEHLGISAVSLTQSLNGNPTLSRLQEVADILGVEVPDLFEREQTEKEVFGCLYVGKRPVIIKNVDDINKLLDQIKNS